MNSIVTRVAVALLACAATALPAAAQDTLIIGGWQVDAVADPGRPIRVVTYDLMRPLAGGGRYSVRDLDVRDLRTGRIWPLPEGSEVLTVDPSRPRIFLRENCDIPADRCDLVERNVETGAARTLATIAASSATGGVTAVARYAADVDVLFIDQAPSRPLLVDPIPHAIRGLNLSSGAWVGPTLSPRRGWWSVTADGSRVVAVQGLTVPVQNWARSYEVATGAEVAASDQISFSYQFDWSPALHAFVEQSDKALVFDADLRVLATQPGGRCGAYVGASAHTGRIFFLGGGGSSSWGPVPHRFLAFDPVSGWSAHDINQKIGLPAIRCAGMVLLSPPGAPEHVAGTVAGHNVTLRWGNTSSASRFELEIGLGPGRTDLTTAVGPDPRVSFAGVPSGTYYVRIRGVNEFGRGRVSAEHRVTVP